MNTVVEVANLRRVYTARRGKADVVALHGLDLTVAKGEVHGLLGPNGAGKTTLVKILSTVLLPTSGTATVLGFDVASSAGRVRAGIGVVFGGERGLYTRVSARRNLSFWAALYGLGARESAYRIDALLARVGLGDRADEPVERYSRGMKQRLHLARGLLHDPAVLFLDEPTTGMDPVAARDLRSLVREVTGDGRTVLLTTHDMTEAEALCDNVSLIDRGRLLLSGPIPDVAGHLGVREWVTFSSIDRGLVAELGALSLVDEVIADTERDGEWRVRPASPEAVGTILIWLVERGVLTVRCDRPSLEEVYLRVVGSRGMTV